jgi:hypothetical protein
MVAFLHLTLTNFALKVYTREKKRKNKESAAWINNLMGGTPMRKYLITLTVAAFGLAMPAQAGFINLNAPFVAGPTFTPLPGNMVQVTGTGGGHGVSGYQTPTECFPGGGCLESATATFGTNFIGQLTSNFNYTTSGTSQFNFNGMIFDPNGSGTLLANDQLVATITWNSFFFPNDGNPPGAANLFGTGLVTSSSGDALFEGDFPLGGTFDITVDLLCGGHINSSCLPDQPVGTVLSNGSLIPTPSPLIGKPGWPMLLCLTVLGLVRRYRNGVNQTKAGRAASLV